eukprot:352503-Chlamydomonas_euryale.AAC.2
MPHSATLRHTLPRNAAPQAVLSWVGGAPRLTVPDKDGALLSTACWEPGQGGSRALLGTCAGGAISLDLATGRTSIAASELAGAASGVDAVAFLRGPASRGAVVVGFASGRLALADPRAGLRAAGATVAHVGGLACVDARGDAVVTCGYAMRMGQVRCAYGAGAGVRRCGKGVGVCGAHMGQVRVCAGVGRVWVCAMRIWGRCRRWPVVDRRSHGERADVRAGVGRERDGCGCAWVRHAAHVGGTCGVLAAWCFYVCMHASACWHIVKKNRCSSGSLCLVT